MNPAFWPRIHTLYHRAPEPLERSFLAKGLCSQGMRAQHLGPPRPRWIKDCPHRIMWVVQFSGTLDLSAFCLEKVGEVPEFRVGIV